MALWDTAEHYSVVRDTPAGRDLVGPFCEAMRKQGLKTGLYYSHLDWTHPDYPSVYHSKRPKPGNHHPGNKYAYPIDGKEDPARWENFLRFHRLQLQELCQRYSPDLLWFEGSWEHSDEQWRFEELRKQLHTWCPGVILNSRMGEYGDYETPEQGVPIVPPKDPWEFCLTMNRSWSMATDPSYKIVPELIRLLADCAAMGDNMLLNIAPLSDGTIFYEQARILREIGAWLRPRGVAIYDTVAGLPYGHFYGPSTLSKTGDTLYLFQFDIPQDEISVKGIKNAIRSVTLLDDPDTLLPTRLSGGAHWAGIPPVLKITVPTERIGAGGVVIKIELDGPLSLYTGHGEMITQN